MNHPQQNTRIRFFYLDNLRAIAMLLGVFLHAALAYSPITQELWPTPDPQNSRIIDAFLWFIHLFRMPLFFVIAGFFALYMIKKRGIAGHLKNRLLRIALPFVIFWPLIIIAVGFTAHYSVTTLKVETPIFNLIVADMEIPKHNNDTPSEKPETQAGDLTTMHLWFLYYLMMLCILGSILYKIGGRFWQQITHAATTLRILAISTVILLPTYLVIDAPHPAPEQFTPTWWGIVQNGLFFALGWLLFTRMSLIDDFKKHWPILATIGTLSTIGYYVLLPKIGPTLDVALASLGKSPPLTAHHFFTCLLASAASISLVMLSLVAGKALLNQQSKTMRYIADASYWIYIIHIPLLFLVQAWLITVEQSIWVKFLGSSFGIILFGLLTYTLLVRWTPIGWMLNGKVSKQSS